MFSACLQEFNAPPFCSALSYCGAAANDQRRFLPQLVLKLLQTIRVSQQPLRDVKMHFKLSLQLTEIKKSNFFAYKLNTNWDFSGNR